MPSYSQFKNRLKLFETRKNPIETFPKHQNSFNVNVVRSDIVKSFNEFNKNEYKYFFIIVLAVGK